MVVLIRHCSHIGQKVELKWVRGKAERGGSRKGRDIRIHKDLPRCRSVVSIHETLMKGQKVKQMNINSRTLQFCRFYYGIRAGQG